MMYRSVKATLIVCVVAVAAVMGSEEHVGSASVHAQSEHDMVCGPRCLWALMELTNVGKADCDVEFIYGLPCNPDGCAAGGDLR